jgi:hypothetical protein
MKATEVMRLTTNYKEQLIGKTRKQIVYEFNELAERTNGSLIDGIKLGYLYSILYGG